MRLTKASTCLSLNLNERCDKCNKVKEAKELGKKLRKSFDPTCQQPWRWEIGPSSKTATKRRKQKIVDELNSRGYDFCDAQTTTTSQLFVKRKRDEDVYYVNNANEKKRAKPTQLFDDDDLHDNDDELKTMLSCTLSSKDNNTQDKQQSTLSSASSASFDLDGLDSEDSSLADSTISKGDDSVVRPLSSYGQAGTVPAANSNEHQTTPPSRTSTPLPSVIDVQPSTQLPTPPPAVTTAEPQTVSPI